jgi:hypothetical protein
LKWQRRSKVSPNGGAFRHTISQRKSERPGKFTNKWLLFIVTHDFHLFLHLKKHFAGKKFDDDEAQEEVMTWFKGRAADFYDSGIQKLVPRFNKCLDNAGNYVEK